jgi:glycosyltransferase involved in cell wall biosynthesis
MISILILTRNEQDNLPGCIESVAWSDDIHVFDSYSTDETIAIAQAKGARVTQRQFDNWSAHQNWGLRNLPFKYPWVFYIDADERVTPELREQLRRAALDPGGLDAFRVQRRDFFQGRWLRHVQVSSFYIRLFRPEKMRYERLVNPVSIVDGEVGELPGYLDHFPFSKGISHWIERHNQYSTLEARQIRGHAAEFSLWSAFFEKDFHRRRFHQKEAFFRLPARPLLKFLLLYLGKRGFLDGRPGFIYCVLQAIYEYMIVLKEGELRGLTS